jgi:hypothetical protein
LTTDRLDQLNLPDDPAFMPELDLNFDLSAFEIPLQSSGRSSLLSPPSLVSSRSSQQGEEQDVEEPALELPSGDTSLGAAFGHFDLGLAAALGSVARSESRAGLSVLEEETGIMDVGWEFDEYGNMVETVQAPKLATEVPSADDAIVGRIATDSALSASVRQEHAQGIEAAPRVISVLIHSSALTSKLILYSHWSLKTVYWLSVRMNTFFLTHNLSPLVRKQTQPRRCNILCLGHMKGKTRHLLLLYLHPTDVLVRQRLLKWMRGPA